MSTTFPSSAFFEELRKRLDAASPRFEALGLFDTTFGIRVMPDGGSEDTPGKLVVLSFDAYACTGIRELPFETSTADLDFVLEAPLSVWREMLRSVDRHGHIDSDHTINTLSHHGEPLSVWAADPLGHDKLFRYQESIQLVFDTAASIS